MHTAEEVRALANAATPYAYRKALNDYADLLEAMSEMDNNGSEIAYSVLRALRWRVAEKQKARKG